MVGILFWAIMAIVLFGAVLMAFTKPPLQVVGGVIFLLTLVSPVVYVVGERLLQKIMHIKYDSDKALYLREGILMFVADEISKLPCRRCGGEVIEFSVSNDVWNAVIRHNGPELESGSEYLCVWCFLADIVEWVKLHPKLKEVIGDN